MARSRFFDQFKTRQDIFNFVCQKLWEQNEISVHDSQCQYRNGNSKCAIGHLIPEDFYNERFEGRNFERLLTFIESQMFNPENDTEHRNNSELYSFFKQFAGRDDFFAQMQGTMHDQLINYSDPFRKFLVKFSNEFASAFNLTPYTFPKDQIIIFNDIDPVFLDTE